MKRIDDQLDLDKDTILEDYRLGQLSRQVSLLGRKEVLTGKAKFGIFGDGKEVAQLAMARAFKKGDFRSGYYRDQTFMLAIGELTVQTFFAQLYADADPEREPASSGRQMNAHFATHFLDNEGEYLALTDRHNSSADISPTAAQMLRLVGLGYASKLFRNLPDLHKLTHLSHQGDEVAFGTIGNASCAEGHFWEAVNAIGVTRSPVAISIWDDGYGISVPNEYQVTKENLSELLSGFAYDEEKNQGYNIYRCPGWDYFSLVRMYGEGVRIAREHHIPAIFHITEMTQPQGHSTSGSHERYKSKERLEWEGEFDPLKKMREELLREGIATEEELVDIEEQAKAHAKEEQKAAWYNFLNPIKENRKRMVELLEEVADSTGVDEVKDIAEQLSKTLDQDRRTVHKAGWKTLITTASHPNDNQRQKLKELLQEDLEKGKATYSTHLNAPKSSELNGVEVEPEYADDAPLVDGREVLLAFFDKVLERDARVFIYGEDVGHIGDVNQGLAGMQEKYGKLRVTDTGIREATIVGQGIGCAMRGLRPIAEIQYLDYVLYGLQALSDDLSTLRYRTAGKQKAPLIIRTRGHRLEGIWHSGSPMGTIINSCRGMHICVPRNMTQAAGMYNTLLKGEDPGMVVERLNGYRTKERLPSNIGEYTVPLGVPEVLKEGDDVTLVTYGACVGIALEAIVLLEQAGVDVELIDVQTLLPFDLNSIISESLHKTNKVVFLDEDVPGGATAYMAERVLIDQEGFQNLDSKPLTISSQAHRPAYGNDGDYFSKPNAENVFLSIYNMMKEYNPQRFPAIY